MGRKKLGADIKGTNGNATLKKKGKTREKQKTT